MSRRRICIRISGLIVLLIRYHERILQAGLHLKHVVTGDHRKNIQDVNEIYECDIGIMYIREKTVYPTLKARLWEKDNIIGVKVTLDSSYFSRLQRRLLLDIITLQSEDYYCYTTGGTVASISHERLFTDDTLVLPYVKALIKNLKDIGVEVVLD